MNDTFTIFDAKCEFGLGCVDGHFGSPSRKEKANNTGRKELANG